MKQHSLPYLLVLLLLLGSCSHLLPADTDAYLTRDTHISLPSPVLATPFQRHQLLQLETEQLRESFQVLLEANGEQIELIALTPLGARLFNLRYDGQGVVTEQLLMDERLPPPAQILSDIMLAYWPLASWHASLPPSWKLSDEGAQRLLHDDSGQPIVEIHYRGEGGEREGGEREPIQLIQHHFNYQIHLRQLD